MELLSSPTELGIAFATDARLRPDGEKGLLVNTLAACEEYYRKRAQLWEIQALTRVRPVAGDFKLGAKFLELAGWLTNFKQGGIKSKSRIKSKKSDPPCLPPRRPHPNPIPDLAACSPGWKKRIAHMRARIERERTPAGKEHLAIK